MSEFGIIIILNYVDYMIDYEFDGVYYIILECYICKFIKLVRLKYCCKYIYRLFFF